MIVKLFEIVNERDFRIVRKTYTMCQELNVHCQERKEQMMEMQSFLHVSTGLAASYNLLKELQDYMSTVMFSPSMVTYTSVYIISKPWRLQQASNEELKEPMEDQPLPADASPTTLAPGYVVDSDLEKDEKDP
nr:hypothetical protein [Tanacetum cinerariifolium]